MTNSRSNGLPLHRDGKQPTWLLCEGGSCFIHWIIVHCAWQNKCGYSMPVAHVEKIYSMVAKVEKVEKQPDVVR